MPEGSAALVLLAAAHLRVPARRMRALARGDEHALRDWIANESARRLAEARRDARSSQAALHALGARIVSLEDADYPAGLHDLRDPPAFLTVRGSLPGPGGRAAGTAVIGTREPDAAALQAARELAACVAPPVVSGLARGIDAAAHEGALAAGVLTLAYVGTGLGTTFPPEHCELEARIVASGGAILSEYLPGEAVTPWSLVRRDRLQAAHAAVVVLVASEADGGAMHAMRVARELGRPRFAFEPLGRAAYAGNERALADGARALRWDAASARATIRADGPRAREEPFE